MMDWTFEATDRVSGRLVKIDRRWQNWGPASDPLKGIYPYDPSFCEDERLYRTPDGDYVLARRADELRPYYECDYMPEREARDWFRRKNIPWPDENFANAAPTLNMRSYRSLWELARRVEHALGCVLCAGCNLFCDELRLEWDADAQALGPALAHLDAVLRVISDVVDWINTPNGADDLVKTLFAVQSETRSLIIKVGHSVKPLTWNDDFKKLSLLQDLLAGSIADLASIPELECELHAEALGKLQAPAPATAAADGNIEPRIEPDGTVSGTPTALRTFDALDAGAVKATSAAVTEALRVNAVAVEPAPESKAAVEAATGKRLWTVQAAQPIVYAYLKKHPLATAKAIEAETGIPDSTVCKTQAWIRRQYKRRKGKRSGQARRGVVPLTEKVLAMAKKVAGPDVDVEALIRRCEAEPGFRQTLEAAYDADVANEAQR